MWVIVAFCFVFFQFSKAAVTWDNECGNTKGCFPDCKDSSCSYLVTWQVPTGTDSVKFEIYAEESGSSWVGVAFSSDVDMGSDSGVGCLTSNNDVISFYNTGQSNNQLSSPTTGITSTSVSQANGIISCSFTRDNTANSDSKYYDLKTDYHLFLGIGPISGSSMSMHSSLPYISTDLVDFQSTDIVGRTKVTALVKLHAISMVLAWMLFSTIGIVIARYQKKMLNEKEVLGAKIWFQLHRMAMILVLVFVIIGFIAIFVEIEEYSEITAESGKSHVKAHPVLGIIITCLAIINPTMALFRPKPVHKKRFIFNWAHMIVGVLAHLLSIITVFFGYDLNRVDDVPDGAKHASYAHIAIHVTISMVLEVIKWWIHFKEDSDNPSKTSKLLPQLLLVVHALSMLATTLAVVIIIGKT